SGRRRSPTQPRPSDRNTLPRLVVCRMPTGHRRPLWSHSSDNAPTICIRGMWFQRTLSEVPATDSDVITLLFTHKPRQRHLVDSFRALDFAKLRTGALVPCNSHDDAASIEEHIPRPFRKIPPYIFRQPPKFGKCPITVGVSPNPATHMLTHHDCQPKALLLYIC
ncbi:hypothetical protein LSAT2_021201, partial [Lamellibrachia satsuma]